MFATTPPVDLEGWLNKRGEVNKSWQRRWFVLKGNLLFYFERKGDREPLGMIILEGCTVGKWLKSVEFQDFNGLALFRTRRRGRTVLLSDNLPRRQQSDILPEHRVSGQHGTVDEGSDLCRVRLHEADGSRAAAPAGRNRGRWQVECRRRVGELTPAATTEGATSEAESGLPAQAGDAAD